MAAFDRFGDLLDVVDSYDDNVDDYKQGQQIQLPKQVCSREQSLGPLHWNTQCSVELQRVVDTFKSEEIYGMNFSLTLADPSHVDCPLVGCSIGFTELTGYHVQEIVGRNCRFLLNGVPQHLVDDQTRLQCRSFCATAKVGKEYDGCSEVLPDGVKKCWINLPKGELICIQTNARKSGELFRNMFYIKQCELDGEVFLLALQSDLPEEFETEDPNGSEMQRLQLACYAAWHHLDKSMAVIEQVLASQFWYQAPMRRQNNSKTLDEIVKM
jgi:hypothetical protein